MKRIFLIFILLATPSLYAEPPAPFELEFLVYRAPQALDWSSPGQLFRSTLRNMQEKVNDKPYPHAISHVNIRLQCGKAPPLYRGMAATKSTFSYLWDYVVKGESLDSLLIPVKGRFYTEQEILQWLPVLQETGHVHSLRFSLNQAQCARAKNYLERYEELGLQNIYGGLRSDPLRGEGAGCSAFAVSFLQVLGVDVDAIFPSWRRELRVPKALMSTQSRWAEIGIWGYLWRQENGRWAHSKTEPHVHLRFWDPEKIYQWIQNFEVLPKMKGVSKSREGLFVSVLWDLRKVPIPQDDFFQYPAPLIEKTAQYHLANAQRLLTETELLNQPGAHCQIGSPCRHY